MVGASALTASLSVSGVDMSHHMFIGFLAVKGTDRAKAIQLLCTSTIPVAFFEAPHRIVGTLQDLITGGFSASNRRIVICRELTKMHQEIFRGTITEAQGHIGGVVNKEARGEFTIVVLPN